MGNEDDEERGVPPCMVDTSRRVTKVRVGPNLIGIMEFDQIMNDVLEMGPMDDEVTSLQLLTRVKRCNYVPPHAEEDYADALLAEFKKRCPGP